MALSGYRMGSSEGADIWAGLCRVSRSLLGRQARERLRLSAFAGIAFLIMYHLLWIVHFCYQWRAKKGHFFSTCCTPDTRPGIYVLNFNSCHCKLTPFSWSVSYSGGEGPSQCLGAHDPEDFLPLETRQRYDAIGKCQCEGWDHFPMRYFTTLNLKIALHFGPRCSCSFSARSVTLSWNEVGGSFKE